MILKLNRYLQEALPNGAIGVYTISVVTTVYEYKKDDQNVR